MKEYTKTGGLLKKRIEEMQWAPFDAKVAKNLGLWLGLIYFVVFQAVKESELCSHATDGEHKGVVSLNGKYVVNP